MIAEQTKREVKERYPMIEVEYNRETGRVEVIENHGNIMKAGGKRWLWDYQNPDGSMFPVHSFQIISKLQMMDTRNWNHGRKENLYENIVKAREDRAEKTHEHFKEDMSSRIVEDYNYIAGIRTFFANPQYDTWKSKVFGE